MVCTPCQQAAKALQEKYGTEATTSAPDPPASNEGLKTAVVIAGIGAALFGIAVVASRKK
jgi:hypothetical protein